MSRGIAILADSELSSESLAKTIRDRIGALDFAPQTSQESYEKKKATDEKETRRTFEEGG